MVHNSDFLLTFLITLCNVGMLIGFLQNIHLDQMYSINRVEWQT